ncbi:methyltransferase domain-containing protein [Caldimonas sp. KR1-144]|uniref:methyltransferase domain-containing protein n=1 Tax=Caldimonas sp. KR1-144 TaxID=3400911 RepID=UPI003C0D98FF
MASSPQREPPRPPDAGAVARQWRAARGVPWLHGEVARRMAQRLEMIRVEPARVLDWWAQRSGSRELIAARYPKARIDALEPTAELAAHSAQALRGAWWRRWRGDAPGVFVESAAAGTELAFPAGGAGLVWANMVLHWVADPAALMARWHAALAVDGFLMCTAFGPDTLLELRTLYRELGWPAPSHDFIDMHDLGDALVQAGFADPVMDMETLTLTWPDAAALLDELRTLGGNAAAGRFAGLRTPRWRRALEARLTERLRGPDGRLALRFELVYGHAFKPAPKLRVAAETKVSVERLRDMARQGRAR